VSLGSFKETPRLRLLLLLMETRRYSIRAGSANMFTGPKPVLGITFSCVELTEVVAL
jgi:hypothetical protein